MLNNMLKKNLLIGSGLALFLCGISFVLYLEFTYMGATNKEIETLIFGQFKWDLVFMNFKILLAYIVISFFISGFAMLLDLEKPLSIFFFHLFTWLMFWVRGVKLFPILFKEQLYAKSFILRRIQVFITDYVPITLIYALFIGAILFLGIRKKRVLHSLGILALCFLFIVKINPTAVEAAENSSARPNILIIATDSLRPQSISYNGYHRQTPNIDKLFSGGINFVNAKTSMGRTLPSWTTILTSTYPPDNQMRHMFPHEKIPENHFATLVDEFNKNGYYTAAVSDFAGDIFASIPYGFQYVKAPTLNVRNVLKQRCQGIHYFLMGFLINPVGRALFPEMLGMPLNKDPWYVTQHTKTQIKHAVKENTPFFILSFSSSNHFPYCTNFPYYQVYSGKNYIGKHKYGLSSEVLESFLETAITPEEREEIVNLYDNGTKLFDDNVGDLLAYLERSGIAKNTIVVIMSDHGENLYEGNYGMAHGEHLLGSYATNLVFGVYSPFESFKGRRIEETVRDIDIAPTLLELVDVEIPSSFKGTSLLPVMRGAGFNGLPAYMETGLWYSPGTPYLPHRLRIPYPGIERVLEIQMPEGRIALKKEYENIVISAKYKAYQLNGKKYVYMPGEHTYRDEYYIDEKLVKPEDITDPVFLSFKQKMVEMFKDKFYIDEKGFIREHVTEQPVKESRSQAGTLAL